MDEDILPTPELVATVQPLPFEYDKDDSRVNTILYQVAMFCGKTFTEVPQNPDEEPGVPVLLDDEEKPIDPDDPDKEGQIDPDIPGEKYPEGTSEEPNPDLDKLREQYQQALARNLEEKKSYWSVLWQVIRLISVYSCWTDSFDDTFILQHRYQTFDMEQLKACFKNSCKCKLNQPIRINILYAPLDNRPQTETDSILDKPVPAFIDGKIEYINCNGEIVTEFLSSVYLESHYNANTQQLTINPNDFDIFYSNKCECPENISIEIHYNAGYLTIPPALLPLICQLIGRINDATVPLSDCAGSTTQVSGLLKSKKVGNVQYTWSDNETEASKTQAIFTQIFNLSSLAELNSISRCPIVNEQSAGVVI